MSWITVLFGILLFTTVDVQSGFIPSVTITKSSSKCVLNSDIKIICKGRDFPNSYTTPVRFSRENKLTFDSYPINISKPSKKYSSARLPKKPIADEPLIIEELTISNVQYSDDGIYKCAITDETDNEYSDTIEITIEGPPMIRFENTTNIDGILGQQVKLNCMVRSYPTANSVQWLDPRGKLIDNFFTPGLSLTVNSNYSVSIDDLNVPKLGTYNFIISNSYGSANKSFNVTANPKLEIVEPEKEVFSFDEPVTFRCTATNIPPESPDQDATIYGDNGSDSFMWRFKDINGKTTRLIPSEKNSEPKHFRIHLEEGFQTVRSSVLSIWKAEFESQGTYICAHKINNTELSTSKSIRIQGPPIVSSNTTTVTSLPGPAVRIYCNVTARPPANVSWFKDAREIDLKSGDYSVNNYVSGIYLMSTLIINCVVKEDYGVHYVCEAVNEINKKRLPVVIQDLDECANDTYCSEEGSKCINGLGSYHCECYRGYKMVNKHCTALNPKKPKANIINFTHVGVGIGCALVVSATVVACAIVFHKKRRDSFIKKMTPTFNVRYNISKRNSAISEGIDNGGLEMDRDAFPRNRLKFLDHLGEGKFGKVLKAEALSICKSGKWDTVAVKMWKDTCTDGEKEDFYHELMIIKKITPHQNVVAFFGTSKAQGSDSVLMIMEYVPGGDLLKFLRKKRKQYNQNAGTGIDVTTGESAIGQMTTGEAGVGDMTGETTGGDVTGDPSGGGGTTIKNVTIDIESTPPSFHPDLSPKDLLCFSHQIAKGLNHIASLKIVHRDVAARNILVGENNICKISDFGLARDVEGSDNYERTTKGPLPIRWMSIESLRDNIHTTKSDVWSYGVCLWEIATFGASPYPGKSAKMAMESIIAGNNLECPNHCKQEFYGIMESCWEAKPANRPGFDEVIKRLEGLLEDEGEYMMLDCFDEGVYCVIDANTAERV